MKLKKGDKFTLYGFEVDTQNNLSKIVFETAGGNKVEFFADGEQYQYHSIGRRMVDRKTFEEELEV